MSYFGSAGEQLIWNVHLASPIYFDALSAVICVKSKIIHVVFHIYFQPELSHTVSFFIVVIHCSRLSVDLWFVFHLFSVFHAY